MTNKTHAIFDESSLYNEIRSTFLPEDKLEGYFIGLRRRLAEAEQKRMERPKPDREQLDDDQVSLGFGRPVEPVMGSNRLRGDTGLAADSKEPVAHLVWVDVSGDDPVIRQHGNLALSDDPALDLHTIKVEGDRLRDASKLLRSKVKARVFLIDRGVLGELQEMVLESEPTSKCPANDFFKTALRDESLRESTDIADLFACLPEIEAVITPTGSLSAKTIIHGERVPLPDTTSIVVVFDPRVESTMETGT